MTLGNLEFAGLLRMSRGEGRLLANSTNQQYCISITKMTGETPDVRSDKRKQREERGEREKRKKKREIERNTEIRREHDVQGQL